MNFQVHALPADQFANWVTTTRAAGGPVLDAASYATLSKQSSHVAPFTYHDADPTIFAKIVTPTNSARPRPAGRDALCRCLQPDGAVDARKAHLVGDPVRPAHSSRRGCPRGRRGHRRACPRHVQRLAAVPLERVDHQCRPQARRHHVLPAGARHAVARIQRRAPDAFATGARIPLGRLFAAGTLRPDLLGPRHADDLLRCDAVRDRPDELCRASATRRARRGVPHAQLRQLLAHRDGRAAGQFVAGGG